MVDPAPAFSDAVVAVGSPPVDVKRAAPVDADEETGGGTLYREPDAFCPETLGNSAASTGGVPTRSRELRKRIKRHRQAAGLVQEELVHRAEVHRTHVGFIASGKRSTSVDVLGRVAQALKVATPQLLAEAEAEAASERG